MGSLTVYEKIAAATKAIKAAGLKKNGWNDYSKFHYYLPEDISKVVYEACENLQLFNKFNLDRNELGIFGELIVMNLEQKGDDAIFKMAMDIPQIKATNVSQQLGGAMTYSKRYMFQNVFDIVDNSTDPDSTSGKPTKPTPPPPKEKPKNKEGKTVGDFKSMNMKDRENYIIDLISSRQFSRVNPALAFCAKHGYLSNQSIKDLRSLLKINQTK